ncbi:metal-sulfur cluster assembly factor [Streptococcus zalophi]|uniref:Metal-sulfur cluster assembly factor n=1 Tax=Streptococcus zalophi TaxID=640031 RepID=A0A934PA17_9STRE|nr:metal-sulfur cluster assembly factor [Streptococcus zalophi]MBJ8349633.1 metal-sulfur cluster assembly factor [Streptococcus zalophi]MCR8968018.1 metal-sulfur cluster assembly factor [Streptococcus zalophi]
MSEKNYSLEEVEIIKGNILKALEQVIDPELGIDIVNLGLVYEIRFDDDGATEIDMTLTTMGCPLADLLTDQIYDVMKGVPEVTKVDVKLVWYPAWSVDKMSRYARIALGVR